MDEAKAMELGRRALAAGWRWMPGALGRTPDMVIRSSAAPYVGAWPDFRDPATVGVLLAQVRERWGDPDLYARRSDTRRLSDGMLAWEVLGWADAEHSPTGKPVSWRGWGYATEAEALVAVLEAALGREER